MSQMQLGEAYVKALENDALLEACARAAHEANRAYCLALNDTSQPSWENAPEWQKKSALEGVKGALQGNTPEMSHISWMRLKIEEGWVYGPEKDTEKKTHPCVLPYDALPPSQKMKDHIFIAVVKAVSYGLMKSMELL